MSNERWKMSFNMRLFTKYTNVYVEETINKRYFSQEHDNIMIEMVETTELLKKIAHCW